MQRAMAWLRNGGIRTLSHEQALVELGYEAVP